MVKLICVTTCYMPTGLKGKGAPKVERYEDVGGEDIYEVPDDRVDEFLATGSFKPVD